LAATESLGLAFPKTKPPKALALLLLLLFLLSWIFSLDSSSVFFFDSAVSALAVPFGAVPFALALASALAGFPRKLHQSKRLKESEVVGEI
jgi:hypothetical protein